jgi:hypothetical protein
MVVTARLVGALVEAFLVEPRAPWGGFHENGSPTFTKKSLQQPDCQVAGVREGRVWVSMVACSLHHPRPAISLKFHCCTHGILT